MAPRKYDLGRRRAAAEQTQQRILHAVRALVAARETPEAVTMESVARKAGVARMTVYYQFQSRSGLLEALADDLAAKGGMANLAGAFMEPDPAKAVRRFIRTFVEFWASDRIVLRRLRALGILFPVLSQRIRGRDAWRREGARNLLGKLGVPERASGGPSAEEAADLLSALSSFETFDALCEGRRTPEVVAELLGTAALTMLGIPPN